MAESSIGAAEVLATLNEAAECIRAFAPVAGAGRIRANGACAGLRRLIRECEVVLAEERADSASGHA